MSATRRDDQRKDARGRLAIVRSVVRSTRPDTEARDAAIAETAAKVALLGARGQRGRVSEATLRRWIACYEVDGEAGLMRFTRQRTPHVRLSREWDAAMLAADVDELSIFAIAEAVRGCIRAAWRVTTGGWRSVQIVALPTVASLTRAAGVPMGDDLLAGPCMLPRQTIERDAPGRLRPRAQPEGRRLSND